MLGAILLENEAIGRIGWLNVEAFYRESHREIYKAMLALRANAKPIDAITLSRMLKAEGALEAIGGPGYLAEVAAVVPSSRNIEHYAAIVRDMSIKREIASRATQLASWAYDGMAVDTLVGEMERTLKPGEFGPPSETALAPPGLVTLNVEELLQRQAEPRDFIIEPVLREKDLLMLYSWRGVGKTLVALDMAYAIASGCPCLKWQAPKPRRVLYIDGELPLQVIKERVARLAAANDREPPSADYLQFITPDAQERPIPNLADPKAQALIDQIIVDKKIEVLFIDSISTLCSSGRENEAESWLTIQEWALRLRRRGVTVIFLHHAGKGGAQRGTSRREDILDTVMHLVHPPDYQPEEGSRFEVHFEKTRALWGEALRPFEAKLEIINGAATWTMRDVEDLNHSRAKELFDDGISVRDVAEALGISRSAASRLKIKLKKEAKE